LVIVPGRPLSVSQGGRGRVARAADRFEVHTQSVTDDDGERSEAFGE
jgi:hypothetical protein